MDGRPLHGPEGERGASLEASSCGRTPHFGDRSGWGSRDGLPEGGPERAPDSGRLDPMRIRVSLETILAGAILAALLPAVLIGAVMVQSLHDSAIREPQRDTSSSRKVSRRSTI